MRVVADSMEKEVARHVLKDFANKAENQGSISHFEHDLRLLIIDKQVTVIYYDSVNKQILEEVDDRLTRMLT